MWKHVQSVDTFHRHAAVVAQPRRIVTDGYLSRWPREACASKAVLWSLLLRSTAAPTAHHSWRRARVQILTSQLSDAVFGWEHRQPLTGCFKDSPALCRVEVWQIPHAEQDSCWDILGLQYRHSGNQSYSSYSYSSSTQTCDVHLTVCMSTSVRACVHACICICMYICRVCIAKGMPQDVLIIWVCLQHHH